VVVTATVVEWDDAGAGATAADVVDPADDEALEHAASRASAPIPARFMLV
jgi:hypothetical protein